jgi:hypothetical protein
MVLKNEELISYFNLFEKINFLYYWKVKSLKSKRGGMQLHLCFCFHYCFKLLGVGTLTLTIVHVFFFLKLQVFQPLRLECIYDE